MGPETRPEPEVPGRLPDEETPLAGETHRVAARRPDGPLMDEVLPPIPADREHHGG